MPTGMSFEILTLHFLPIRVSWGGDMHMTARSQLSRVVYLLPPCGSYVSVRSSGLVASASSTKSSHQAIRRNSWILYINSCPLLVALLCPETPWWGHYVKLTRRWDVPCSGTPSQPSLHNHPAVSRYRVRPASWTGICLSSLDQSCSVTHRSKTNDKCLLLEVAELLGET